MTPSLKPVESGSRERADRSVHFGMKLEEQQAPAVIVPELFRMTGGVQVFSRRLIEAMDGIFGRPVPVISRNDRRADVPADFLHQREFRACGDNHVALRRFAVIGACLAVDAPSFVSTHPHFTPWLCYQRRVLKQPYMAVAHGIDVWNIESRFLATGLEKSECVLAVSRFTERKLRSELGAGTPQVEIFPNTFEENRFIPGTPGMNWREKLEIPPACPILLSVCRVSRGESGKGYDRVLEVLPDLLKEYPGLTWVLGGKGDDLERVIEKANSLGVADRCRFPGYVDDADLPDLYRSADVFVLPSKKEGFGIVFLEATACGLPVIAGNRDGSVDALDGGVLGTLIDPDDPAALLGAIHAVLGNPRPEPRALHRGCVERFGRKAFQARLAGILKAHPRMFGYP